MAHADHHAVMPDRAEARRAEGRRDVGPQKRGRPGGSAAGRRGPAAERTARRPCRRRWRSRRSRAGRPAPAAGRAARNRPRRNRPGRESVRAGRPGDDRRRRRRRRARLTLRIGLLQQAEQVLDHRRALRRRAGAEGGEIRLVVGDVVAPHRGPIGALRVEVGDRRRRVRQGGDRRLNLRGVGVEREGERRLGGVGLLPRRLRAAGRLMGDDARFAHDALDVGQRQLGGGDEGRRIGVVRVAGLRRRFVIMDFGRQAEGRRRRRGERDQAAREGDGADAAGNRPRAVEHDQAQLRLGLGEVAHDAGSC